MKQKKFIWQIGRLLAISLAAVLLCLGALFGLAQTDMGKRRIERLVADVLSKQEERTVEIKGLRGMIPFDFQVDHIVLKDPLGRWLAIQGISLRWSPLSLFRGIFHIEELRVTNAKLSRLAQDKDKAEASLKPLPSWPSSLRRLCVDRFDVEQLNVGDAVLGKSKHYRVAGKLMSISPGGDRLSFLRLDRIDGVIGSVFLAAALKGKDPVLAVEAEVNESADGLFANLLRIRGPVFLTLRGEGPVQGWDGMFRASIGGIGEIEADVGLAIHKTLKITAEGMWRPAPGLMPAQMASGFGPDNASRFRLAVRLPRPAVLCVDTLTLSGGGVDIQLSGTMDLNKRFSEGNFGIRLNLMGFKNVSVGDLMAEGHFSGPLLRPQSTINLKAQGVEGYNLRTSELGGIFDLELLGDLGSHFPGIQIRGNGNIENVSFQDAQNSSHPFPDKHFKWKFDAYGPMEQKINIREFKLEGEKLTMELSGQADTSGPSAAVDVMLNILDAQGFSDLFGFELPGPARLNAKIEADRHARSLTAHVQGKINLLSQDYKSIASLTGKEINCAGRFTLAEGKTLAISELRFDAKPGIFTAHGSLDLSKGRLHGAWRVSVPKLSVFSPGLKRGMEGSLRVDGGMKGDLKKMMLDANLTAENLLFEGLRFEQALATVHAHGSIEEGNGDLSVKLRQTGKEALATADFALKGRRLTLSPLFMEAAGSSLNGHMTFHLDRDLAEGALKAECGDISDLASLFGKKLKGSVDIKTQFQIIGADQQVIFVVGAKELASGAGHVNSLKLSGHLTNLKKTPQGNALLNLEGFFSEDLSVSSLTLRAEGDARQATFSGSVKGNYKAGFEMETSGNLAVIQEGLRLNLEQLHGQVGGSTLVLERPAQVKRTASGWEIEHFAFNLDRGSVEGLGSFGDGALHVDVKFGDIPLDVLQVAGLTDLTGIATGNIYLVGPLSHPEGSIVLHLDAMRLRDAQQREFPPSTLRARAELKKDGLQADVTLEGLAENPFEANIKMPIIFSLAPFAWSIPAQGELQGRLAGEFDLAHTFLFVDLPDQDVDGKVEINLSMDGTAGDPKIKGYVRMIEATYENVRSGTLFKDGELEIVASTSRLVVEHGLMKDGEGGIISLQGWLDFVPKQGFPFNMDFDLEKVALIRQDHATATASGRLSISGSLSEAVLGGHVNILSADLQIPKRLPPVVTELNVVEINRVGGDTEGRQIMAAGPREHVLELDVSASSPGQVFIRGRGLDSEWKGDLRLTGSADKPVITGRLSVVRGFFIFFSKHFNLKEGQINFYGEIPPSPSLNVLAEYSTKDMTTYLRLSGHQKEPLIELSSEPLYPKDEILSRILFGRSIIDITPVQAVQLAQAVSSTARGGGFDLMGHTRRFLGVDQLEFKQSENGTSEGGIEGTAISVGKYVHERVYMTAERGMQEASGKVTVEVEVTPKISVETEVKENAESGVGLKWKWNY